MKAENRTDFLDRDQLRRYFEQGCKPSSEWGIGSEYENFIVDLNLEKPVSYAGPKSISKVFDLLMNKFDWVPVFEKSNIVGLEKDKANISLEPGGQFELSGAIKKTVHEVDQEMTSFMQNMQVICEELDLGLFSMGATPFWKREEMPIMPKNRYKKIMMPYMKTVGTQGLDMMLRTCTIQVNLDYSSEADMAKKLRVAACIQPFVTALFASSPIFEGNNTGYQSWRAQVWKNTDKDRKAKCLIRIFTFKVAEKILHSVLNHDVVFSTRKLLKYHSYLLSIELRAMSATNESLRMPCQASTFR